jgi:glutaredoxin 3
MGILGDLKADIRARLFGPEYEGPEAVQATKKVEVVMYATRFCPFCMRARALLQQKQVPYREIAVDGNPEARKAVMQKSGRNTVPQIWIGEAHVGGCDELMQLERTGELDKMLAVTEEPLPRSK